jgi:hypothetical protein
MLTGLQSTRLSWASCGHARPLLPAPVLHYTMALTAQNTWLPTASLITAYLLQLAAQPSAELLAEYSLQRQVKLTTAMQVTSLQSTCLTFCSPLTWDLVARHNGTVDGAVVVRPHTVP